MVLGRSESLVVTMAWIENGHGKVRESLEEREEDGDGCLALGDAHGHVGARRARSPPFGLDLLESGLWEYQEECIAFRPQMVEAYWPLQRRFRMSRIWVARP